jgi:hypothetical protein
VPDVIDGHDDVYGLPRACCDGLESVIKDAPVYLCHGMSGDMNSLMPKPIDPVSMMILQLTCGTMLPLQIIFSCNSKLTGYYSQYPRK